MNFMNQTTPIVHLMPLFTKRDSPEIFKLGILKPSDFMYDLSYPGSFNYWEHTQHSAYFAASKPNREIPIDFNKLFPDVASVSSESNKEASKNRNNIRSESNMYIFLDCGRWLGNSRDFGVVYGRHVYLCSYDDGQYDIEYDKSNDSINDSIKLDHSMVDHLRPGLDKEFFKGMINGDSGASVRIVSWTTAFFDTDDKYDLEHIYIVIPDLHLMAYPINKIWDEGYKMLPEIGLLNFVTDLLKIEAIQAKLKVVQIGDCYDLWVGHGFPSNQGTKLKPVFSQGSENEPLFYGSHEKFKNNSGKDFEMNYEELEMMKINPHINEFQFDWALPYEIPYLKYGSPQKVIQSKSIAMEQQTKSILKQRDYIYYPQGGFENSYHYLITAIKHIQGELPETPNEGNWPWLFDRNFTINPAEMALRALQLHLCDNLIYLYGNHDNYLICDDLADLISADFKKIHGPDKSKYFNKRKEFHENKSLFIEHGHRMEAAFSLKVPKNFDGCWSGFKETCDLFEDLWKDKYGLLNNLKKPLADRWASIHDQPSYNSEIVKMKLGRKGKNDASKMPPNIFVIGHTHRPKLEFNKIIVYDSA